MKASEAKEQADGVFSDWLELVDLSPAHRSLLKNILETYYNAGEMAGVQACRKLILSKP